MTTTKVPRALAVSIIAALILAMTSCGGGGGGSNFNSGGSSTTTPPPALTINTTTLPYAINGVAYQQTVSASGGTPPYTWTSSNVLPQGLTLSTTGTITGTPAYQGNFGLGVQVADSGSPRQTASAMLPFQIVPQITFVSNTLPNAHISAAYDFVVAVTAIVDPASWRIVSGNLPQGLQLTSLSSNQIEIAGTTTQMGSFPITLQVQDSNNPPQVVQQSYTLTVDNAMAITTQKLSAAIFGSNYSVALSAVNGIPPYRWSAVGMPAALAVDGNSGTISGVPSVYGIFQPTITVTDSGGHTASQTFGLTVIGALTIPNYGTQTAVVNKYFNDNLIAFGGIPPYNWSIVSGALPTGLAFDSQHAFISGIPTQLGSSAVTLQVIDSGSPQQTAQAATTFAVVAPQLYVVGTLPASLPLGVPVQWSPAAQGGTPPYHWNPASGNMPPGLSFDPNTGDLTGTPTTLGQYTFSVSVTDSGAPPQTASSSYAANITTPLGRNDSPAHATPLGDGSWLASISPYTDPPQNSNGAPDTDYFRIIGNASTVVTIRTSTQSWSNSPLDTVLELVDGNGIRLNACRLPGDTSNNFNSACLNDDIVQGVNHDSQLDIMVPGQTGSQTPFYAHVLDWRGDARPDMQYYLMVSGSVQPLKVVPPSSVTYGSGYSATSACPAGQTCSAQFTTSGGTTPITWAVQSGNVPLGMALDPTSGTLSGTPSASGAYSFVTKATDSATPSQIATATYTLTIENPPKITTTSLPNGLSGQPYNQTLAVGGGTPPYTWSIYVVWDYHLNFDTSTGTISGTPAQTGTYDLSLSVIDSLGLGDSKHLSLTIGPGPFSFPNGSYPNAQVGVLYVGYPSGPVGGTTPYTFTLASGSIPLGLTLDGNGSITGTPTMAGTYTFALTATDSSPTPQSATATVTLTIMP